MKVVAYGQLNLLDDQRLMSLLDTYHPIKSFDDQFPEKLVWCLEHCNNKFRDIKDENYRIWYFQNEHDATMFAMRWAS